MSINERLLELEDLKITETLPHLTKQQLDEYIETLNSFVEDFPRLEAEIKETSEKKDYESMHGKVLVLGDKLAEIGADDIATECRKYAGSIQSDKLARFEAYVHFLLTQLAALSIDIQMALFKEEEQEAEEAPPEEAAPPAAPEAAPEEKPVEVAAAPVAPAEKIILAVDDDPHCLDMFKMALKNVRTLRIWPVCRSECCRHTSGIPQIYRQRRFQLIYHPRQALYCAWIRNPFSPTSLLSQLRAGGSLQRSYSVFQYIHPTADG